jgi:hypothetical protein
MKKHFLVLFALVSSFVLQAQTDTLLHGYNSKIYSSVLSAAEDIAMPYLIDQKYISYPNATIKDSTITYYGLKYHVHNYYLNPTTGYYIANSLYSTYGINIFSKIWPTQIPNIFFKASDTSFYCQSDCVGYLTRLLSATGDTTATGNAYTNIMNTVRTANTSPFAAKGYVATAYEFAAGFPTLPTKVTSGWQYVCGNMEADSVNAYNHILRSVINTYNGFRQGGFASSQAGDVLAFGYSASQSSNGHVMVMEKSPQLLTNTTLSTFFPAKSLASAKTLLKKRHIYSVTVFDCSGLKAHFQDSRILTSGIGHGTLLVYTDTTDDAPLGFVFDTTQANYNPLHSDTLGAAVYVISVGRFVTTAPTGAIDMGIINPSIKAYPNPGSNMLNIELPSKINGLVTIYNADGKVIAEQNTTSTLLNLSTENWPNGLYLIQYKMDNGGNTAIKWVKQQ